MPPRADIAVVALLILFGLAALFLPFTMGGAAP